MMKVIMKLATILILFISVGAFASKVDSLKVKVTGSKGSFTSTTNATLTGNFTRYVNRLLDGNNYKAMRVPNIMAIKQVGANKYWVHMRVYGQDTQFYTRVTRNRGARKFTGTSRLTGKAGSYPENHKYVFNNGRTTVKLISGSPKNGKFTVNTVNRVKFKPGTPDVGIKDVMRRYAKGTVRALAK